MEERRNATRCTDISVIVHQFVVTYLGQENWLSATSLDISSQGLSVLLEDSIDPGRSVYLLAAVKPEGKEPRDLSVNGVTTYCRPTEGKGWRVGIQFMDLTAEDQADWDEYLNC